jgi:hypothetical protein
VKVLLHDPITAGDRWDHYQEVDLRFADGRHYRTSFWRDPQERGRHWWEEPEMVIVHDLTTDLILAAVDDLLRQGAVAEAFEPVGGHSRTPNPALQPPHPAPTDRVRPLEDHPERWPSGGKPT